MSLERGGRVSFTSAVVGKLKDFQKKNWERTFSD